MKALNLDNVQDMKKFMYLMDELNNYESKLPVKYFNLMVTDVKNGVFESKKALRADAETVINYITVK